MCPVPENRTKIGRLIIGLCLVVIIISIIFTQTQEHRKQLDLDFETCRDKKIFQYEFKQAFYELEYVNIYKIGGKSEVSSNSQSRKKLSHGPMVNDQMLEFYNNYMKVSQSMLEYSEVWPKASLSKLDKLNIINLKKAANHLIRSNKNKSLYTVYPP